MFSLALQFGYNFCIIRSFCVGDAAGRKGDHSDADIKFAQVFVTNISAILEIICVTVLIESYFLWLQANGLKFFTPEEYFIA